MSKNVGKQFEQAAKISFLKSAGVSIDRIKDSGMKYKKDDNICDFIVYRKPYEFYIECKSVHGNTLPFSNIRENQWNGLYAKSKIEGVISGVLCWWVDADVTLFIPIQVMQNLKESGAKSIRYDVDDSMMVTVSGKKKRVYYSYDMTDMLDRLEDLYDQIRQF